MNNPIAIEADSFQVAWASAMKVLKDHGWGFWNLVVNIRNPIVFNDIIHQHMTDFADTHHLIKPNLVAYTIFPFGLCINGIPPREKLYYMFKRYLKVTKQDHHGWGTYFQRMTCYKPDENGFDQLGNIIDNINSRDKLYTAANTILIPYPHKDNNKIMGAPCLNYLTVQLERNPTNNHKVINLLAVYRNHDFMKRAYGNYQGLCKLLEYIAHQTNAEIGSVTCLSSHAYVSNYKTALFNIAAEILEA